MEQAIQPSIQNTVESSPTGIKGLDDSIGGGFPRGAVVLLSGSSGSGKTMISFQWLFEGVKSNENGIYITLTEPIFKSLKNIESMKFYDRSAIEQEKLKIIDMRDIYERDSFDEKKILDFIDFWSFQRAHHLRQLFLMRGIYNLENGVIIYSEG